MELNEIQEQEDLQMTLVRTLTRGWSEEYKTEVTVDLVSGEQPWYVQPRLSTYFTKDVGRTARRFMVQRFRFTPVLPRVPLQWAWGTMLGSKPIIRSCHTGFRVTPSIASSSGILVVPGSRRIRTFNLATRRTRSLLKAGFDAGPMLKEIEVRTRSGPFPPVERFDQAGLWLEEKLLFGFPLPRCPTWWDRKAFEQEACQSLDKWHASTARSETGHTYVPKLVEQLRKRVGHLNERFPAAASSILGLSLDALSEKAMRLENIELSISHGDFQPGNIFVRTEGRQVLLMDWEFSAERFRHYDFLTYGLRARYSLGFAERFKGFVKEGHLDAGASFMPEFGNKAWRIGAICLFILEELLRATTESLSAPYTAPPLGFRILIKELGAINTSWLSTTR